MRSPGSPAGFNFVPGQPVFWFSPTGCRQSASCSSFGWKNSATACICMTASAPCAADDRRECRDRARQRPGNGRLSATTSAFMDAFEIAAHIRKRRPEIRIAFGNVHVSRSARPSSNIFRKSIT